MRRIERGAHRLQKQPLAREINSIDDFHHSFISTGLIPSQVLPIGRQFPRELKEDLGQIKPGAAQGPMSTTPGDHPQATEASSPPDPAIHTPMRKPRSPKMPSKVRRLDLRGRFRRSNSQRGSLDSFPYANGDCEIPSPVRISPNLTPPLRSYLREPAIRFVKGKALEAKREAKAPDEKKRKSTSPDGECFVSSDEDESGGVLLKFYSPIRASINSLAPDSESEFEHSLVPGLASVKLGSNKSDTASGVGTPGKDTGNSDPNGNLTNDFGSHQHLPTPATFGGLGFYPDDAGDHVSGNSTQITHARAAKPTNRTELFQGMDNLKVSKEFSSTVREKYAPRSAFGADDAERGYAEFNGLPEDFSLSVDSPSNVRPPRNQKIRYRRARTYREGDIIAGTDTSILSETSMGFRAMERLGFEKGKGLGRNSDGIAEPIPITVKVGRRGLGYSPGSPIHPDPTGNDSAGTRMADEPAFLQSGTNIPLMPYNHEEDLLINPETLYSVDSYLARNRTRGKLTLLLRNYCNRGELLDEHHAREVFRACMQHMDKVPGGKFSATQVEAIFRRKLHQFINTLDRANTRSDIWGLGGCSGLARD
ncbi:unnamed protein product [Tuber aestivum]|uniref:G-patch domain-containing protein n=1 Tax=Tuber aestivum TaxID=59557 RepID=A0A292Q7K0_9PEZI|nr:unnamed protein product [Tuber aestivum]